MLTRREREVAALLAERWSNREIAEQLGIGVRSVEEYTSRIYSAFGVHTRRDAARIWREMEQ